MKPVKHAWHPSTLLTERIIRFSYYLLCINEYSTKKLGDRSSSKGEDFLTSTKKRKILIGISDGSD